MLSLHPADPDIILVRLPCSFLHIKHNTNTCPPGYLHQHDSVVGNQNFQRNDKELRGCKCHGVHANSYHLAVEHLLSCDDVQLHTEKVIPGKGDRKT